MRECISLNDSQSPEGTGRAVALRFRHGSSWMGLIWAGGCVIAVVAHFARMTVRVYHVLTSSDTGRHDAYSLLPHSAFERPGDLAARIDVHKV